MALFLCTAPSKETLQVQLKELQEKLLFQTTLYVIADTKRELQQVVAPTQANFVVKPYTYTLPQLLHTVVSRETPYTPLLNEFFIDLSLRHFLQTKKCTDADFYILNHLASSYGGEVALLPEYENTQHLYDEYRQWLRERKQLLKGDALTHINFNNKSTIIYIAKPDLDNPVHQWLVTLSDNCNVYVFTLNNPDNPSYDLFEDVAKYYTAAGAKVSSYEEPLSAPSTNELQEVVKSFYRSSGEVNSEGEVHIGLAYGAESLPLLVAQVAANLSHNGTHKTVIALTNKILTQQVETELSNLSLSAQNLFPLNVNETYFGRAIIALLTYAFAPTAENAIELLGYEIGGGERSRYKKARLRLLSTPYPQPEYVDEQIASLEDNLQTYLTNIRKLFNAAPTQEGAAQFQLMLAEIFEGLKKSVKNVSIYNAITRFFEQLFTEMQQLDAAVDAEVMLETLQTLSIRKKADKPAAQPTNITLCTPTQALNLNYEVLVLADMAQDQYPSYKEDSPFVYFSRENSLPTSEPYYLHKRYEFYQLLQKTSSKLALILQAVDRNGEEVQPSLFFNEVIDLYAGEEKKEFDIPQQLFDNGCVHTMFDDELESVAFALSKKVRDERIAQVQHMKEGEQDD